MDGIEDALQGGRDEMRVWGARRFHPFCEDFHRLFFLCVCLVVVVCLFGRGFVLLTLPVK